jgi:hypothetical protein
MPSQETELLTLKPLPIWNKLPLKEMLPITLMMSLLKKLKMPLMPLMNVSLS